MEKQGTLPKTKLPPVSEALDIADQIGLPCMVRVVTHGAKGSVAHNTKDSKRFKVALPDPYQTSPR